MKDQKLEQMLGPK